MVDNQRVTNERHLWPSTIFDQEIKKLQIEQEVSKLAIANYVKPYAHYTSGFESRRSKNKTRNPQNLEDLNFEDPLFQHLKHKIGLTPVEFLQYDNCKIVFTDINHHDEGKWFFWIV